MCRRTSLNNCNRRSNHYYGNIFNTNGSRFEHLSRWLEYPRYRNVYRAQPARVYSAPGSYWNGHRF
ncbi:putative orfan [Tupanvirus soda lake]|uniref:Orfan n=2 Tax=Tupanvirus TaxID=2094720 RepID=A0AC62AAS8_9VIRU|nr:putative orfan [Tupanvirus soda lake]QKU34856.1 putative orfan [Tupanvirus soda lake]